MAKFKVMFSGFSYVEAEDEDEAKEKYNDEDDIYSEREITEVVEVAAFEVII